MTSSVFLLPSSIFLLLFPMLMIIHRSRGLQNKRKMCAEMGPGNPTEEEKEPERAREKKGERKKREKATELNWIE
jgi:hypothetical protein